MKRVLFISIMTALCVAACGEKSNLSMKARLARQARGTNGKPEGAFTSPAKADSEKLLPNGQDTRNVLLSDASVETSIFCTNDLEKSIQEKERMHVLGNSQIIMLQDTEKDIPGKRRFSGKGLKEAPKALVNIVCMGLAASTEKVEAYKNVTRLTLKVNDPATEISAKFSTSNDSIQKARIACGDETAFSKADAIMLPEKEEDTVHIMINATSKLLIETKASKRQEQEYILVDCAQDPAATPENPNADDKKVDPKKLNEPEETAPQVMDVTPSSDITE